MALRNVDGDLALDATVQSLLTELQQKLEPGQAVALDAATLSALEQITVTVANPITGFATETTLAAVLASLQGTLSVAEQNFTGLTDAQLRAADVAVTLAGETVTIANPTADPETGLAKESTLLLVSSALSAINAKVATADKQQTDALTDTELRATPVAVSTGLAQPVQDGGNINVVNFPASQTVTDNEDGTWSYAAGTSGTESITGRVLQITAIALESSASISINGGASITIPYSTENKTGSSLTVEPKGNLINPSITFTGTASYFIEFVT